MQREQYSCEHLPGPYRVYFMDYRRPHMMPHSVPDELVVLIHALDGSDEVARLDAIWSNAVGPLGKAHRMREKAAKITFRVNVERRRADRQAIRAITRARRRLMAGDQFIEQDADLGPLRTALEHLGSPLPEAPSEADKPSVRTACGGNSMGG
jgi:hypothetical protein